MDWSTQEVYKPRTHNPEPFGRGMALTSGGVGLVHHVRVHSGSTQDRLSSEQCY